MADNEGNARRKKWNAMRENYIASKTDLSQKQNWPTPKMSTFDQMADKKKKK